MTKLLAAMLLGELFCIEGYLKRDYTKQVAGRTVHVCVYNVRGDEVERYFEPWNLCPMKRDFCFREEK